MTLLQVKSYIQWVRNNYIDLSTLFVAKMYLNELLRTLTERIAFICIKTNWNNKH